MYNNGVQGYRRTNVMTSDPKRLVLMCYEGTIDSLKIARQKIIEKDYEGKGIAIIKAQDIINELLCSLNFEKGGVIAKGLESLYNYMLRRIIHAEVNRDLEAIDEVVGLLTDLQSAWKEAFYKQPKGIKPEAIELVQEDRTQAVGYANI